MLRISIIGYGNVAYRLSMALKAKGVEIPYIIGRDIAEAKQLAHILNKPENNPKVVAEETCFSNQYSKALESDIVVLAVSDKAIESVADELSALTKGRESKATVLHCSGASHISLLNGFDNYGVLYPLMTLSKTKPVDFGMIPFFLEYSNERVQKQLIEITSILRAEYRLANSEERLKLHVAAVFVSNFINYITGLAFDLSKPNQMFLMPLAIETIRKAYLYEHPSLVQTGPAIRGDINTIEKHLELLKEMPQHREVYKFITSYIAQMKK